MSRATAFPVTPGWRNLLRDIGVHPADVLRRAGLPEDLFAREKAYLSTAEYFRLWRGLEAETGDPSLPLRIGAALSVDVFDPPVFAALCSPDLNTALARLATYRRLVCPVKLHLSVGPHVTTVELEWLDRSLDPPVSLVGTEIVFFVELARMATRDWIVPVTVRSSRDLEPEREFTEYFGVTAEWGFRPAIMFSAADAARPFLTANDEMWGSFEPRLRRRLSELDQGATTADRVRAALLELLPAGSASIATVSRKLGTSARTLQRRLSGERKTFQGLLDETRERLARHYLGTTRLTGAEISFLLGFEDPNSFFRAFHAWTGDTPERVRGALRAGA